MRGSCTRVRAAASSSGCAAGESLQVKRKMRESNCVLAAAAGLLIQALVQIRSIRTMSKHRQTDVVLMRAVKTSKVSTARTCLPASFVPVLLVFELLCCC